MPKFPKNISPFRMKGISPLKDHKKTPDGKVIKHLEKKTEMLKIKSSVGKHSFQKAPLPIGTFHTKGE